MTDLEKRIDRLMSYLHDNYTVDDVKVYDVLNSGIRYLYDNVEWLEESSFVHIIYKALLEDTRFGISEDEVLEAWMDVIYEDEELTVKSTGRDYDFIAVMEVNQNEYTDGHIGEDLIVVFMEEFACLEPARVKHDHWGGILADDDGYATVEAIRKRKFYTVWEDDYEDEQL